MKVFWVSMIVELTAIPLAMKFGSQVFWNVPIFIYPLVFGLVIGIWAARYGK